MIRRLRGSRFTEREFGGGLRSIIVTAIAFVATVASVGTPTAGQRISASGKSTLSADFVLCSEDVRVTCVVDGDTFWFHGTKIRIADIDAPEISQPHCDRELSTGEAARDRLLTLLNAGRFSLIADRRDEDRYGRKLRTVVRGGRSLGEQLVMEGLARQWSGPRRDWCALD